MVPNDEKYKEDVTNASMRKKKISQKFKSLTAVLTHDKPAYIAVVHRDDLVL